MVEEAYQLIRDNLDDFEKRGKYIFKIHDCNSNNPQLQLIQKEEVKEFCASPNRQKPIDLYDLMDVELRMIRQKNLDMDFVAASNQESAAIATDKLEIID